MTAQQLEGVQGLRAFADDVADMPMDRWFVIVMPRILIVVTRLMPVIDGGRM